MKTIVRVSIEKSSDSVSIAQQGEKNNVMVVLEQYGILFTPEQYKQLWKNLKDIKELVAQLEIINLKK